MLYFIGLHVLVACAWLRLLHHSDAASSSELQFALHCMMMAAEGSPRSHWQGSALLSQSSLLGSCAEGGSWVSSEQVPGAARCCCWTDNGAALMSRQAGRQVAPAQPHTTLSAAVY
jgi:hypothetical protein